MKGRRKKRCRTYFVERMAQVARAVVVHSNCLLLLLLLASNRKMAAHGSGTRVVHGAHPLHMQNNKNMMVMESKNSLLELTKLLVNRMATMTKLDPVDHMVMMDNIFLQNTMILLLGMMSSLKIIGIMEQRIVVRIGIEEDLLNSNSLIMIDIVGKIVVFSMEHQKIGSE